MSLIAWSIPGFILFIALEVWLAHRRGQRVYHWAVAVSDLSCGITSQLFNLFTFGISVAVYAWVYNLRLVELDPGAWWIWVLAFVGVDFFYYWWHRSSHEYNLLWAAHIVHHHSEDYNLAVALRQALFTNLTVLPFYLPLALLGIPPLPFAVAKSVGTLYQFWIHTELIGRLGPLEAVLNTPSHHRVHHAVNPQYLDRNYGGIVITWDRIFGTFAAEREAPVYGTTTPLRSLNPLWANVHYLRDILDLGAAASPRLGRCLGYLRAAFARPGWHPEHSYTSVLGPDQLQQRSHQRFDVPAKRGLILYVACQVALAVVGTMALLITATTLPRFVVILGAVVIAAGALTWAGLFERKPWAWPLEVLRVIVAVVLLHTLVA